MRRAAKVTVIGVLMLAGCSADSETSTASSAVGTAPASEDPAPSGAASVLPSQGAGDAVAAADALQPGTYAEVVTTDLVLRSDPGTAPESEIFPGTLNAPMTVYVADGPVAADGYDWYLVEGIRNGAAVGPWSGWVAAAGKDGEIWLEPLGHGGGTWTIGTPAQAPDLDSRSASVTPDGRVVLVGASRWSEGGLRDGVWTYDPASEAWEEAAPATTPVRGARSTSTEDGLVFVFARSDPAVGGRGSMQVFDTETGRWQRLEAPPEDEGVPVTGADGRIYLITSSGLHAYDRAAQAWETTPVEFDHFFFPTSAVGMSDGTILVTEDGGPITRLDPAAGTVEVVADPRMARYDATSAVGPDGRLYLIGGSVQGLGVTCGPRQMGDSSLFAMRLVEAYDFATNEWTTVAPLPMSLWDVSAFATDTGILVVGADAVRDGRVQTVRLQIPGLVADGPLAASDQEPPESQGCGT